MRECDERYAPGETVELRRAVRVGDQLHEIGTRARVLADHGAVVVLHLHGSSAEVATCPADHVARPAESRARMPATRAA